MKIVRFTPLFVLLLLVLTGCNSESNGTETENPAPAANEIDLIPGQTGDLHFSYFIMEFQPVTAGEKVVAKYPFKNVSDRTVTIDNVAKSCYCLSVEYPKKVQPGQVDAITVTFDTKDQAKEVPATHEKMFPVFINGEQLPLETLRLTGRVLPNPNS